MPRLLLVALALLPAAGGCGLLFDRFHTPSVIEGAVTTREAPPPMNAARVRVVLTPAESTRTVIAETTFAVPPRIPFAYQLSYDPARIRQRQTYVVRASLTEGESVLLATNAPVPVITVGSGRSADLVLSPPPKPVQVDTTRTVEAAQPTSASLSGTVTYRDRRALPYGAVVTVELLSLARTDEPAVVTSAVVRTRGEQVPIPFTLAFQPDRIAPRDRYALQARIQIGSRTLYATRTRVSVLTFNAPTDRVEVVVEAAPEPE
jgi:uncharacterized lipoprotein YbaY